MQAICKVSLKAIGNNYEYFTTRAGRALVIPVVKANAYGHGALEVAAYLHEKWQVSTLAVATLEEAWQLAEKMPDISILIFSRVFPQELSDLPLNSIVTIGSMEDANSWLNTEMETPLVVHLNVNTGMNRLGLTPVQAIDLVKNKTSQLDIRGVYSHFSSSDTLETRRYIRQKKTFQNLSRELESIGFQGMLHQANSAAGLREDSDYYDAMRLGISLYGYDTTPETVYQHHLEPAMEIQAPLVRVERLRAGESVSYGEKWQAATDTNIGTLRFGYADGYNRHLTNRGQVSFRGKTYPVVGTVTMDHIMIDLGNDTAITGELFTVMGGEAEAVKISTISQKLGTIPYEICCAISPRVKRQYLL